MFGVSGLCIQRLQSAGLTRVRLASLYALWSVVWLAAHAAGGGITGALLAAAGSLLPLKSPLPQYLLAAILVLGALHHLGWFRLPMPQWHRQVPRHWMGRWPLVGTAAGYGLQLGAGVTTRITNFATYGALAAAFLTGDPLRGAAIMGLFGFVRAVPAILTGCLAYTPQRTFALAFRVGEWEDRVHRASALVLLFIAALLPLTAWRAQ